jgi:hypothetical protein
MIENIFLVFTLVILFAVTGIFSWKTEGFSNFESILPARNTVNGAYVGGYEYPTSIIPLPTCGSVKSGTEYNMRRRELDQLIEKVDSIYADITQSPNIIRSISMPYVTHHDVEPAGVLVGRCRRKLIRERDIHLATENYQRVADNLIGFLAKDANVNPAGALNIASSKITTLKLKMLEICISKQPQLDMPEGVRDPAYYESLQLENLRKTASF